MIDLEITHNKWSSSGFLNGFEKDRGGTELAYLLELMNLYLLNGSVCESFGKRIVLVEKIHNNEKNNHKKIIKSLEPILLFPLIVGTFRTIYITTEKIINIFHFYRYLREKNNSDEFIKFQKKLEYDVINENRRIDIEAEICQYLSHEYSKFIIGEKLFQKWYDTTS